MYLQSCSEIVTHSDKQVLHVYTSENKWLRAACLHKFCFNLMYVCITPQCSWEPGHRTVYIIRSYLQKIQCTSIIFMSLPSPVKVLRSEETAADDWGFTRDKVLSPHCCYTCPSPICVLGNYTQNKCVRKTQFHIICSYNSGHKFTTNGWCHETDSWQFGITHTQT